MTTVFFVHAINTRGQDYDLALGPIRDALAQRRPDDRDALVQTLTDALTGGRRTRGPVGD